MKKHLILIALVLLFYVPCYSQARRNFTEFISISSITDLKLKDQIIGINLGVLYRLTKKITFGVDVTAGLSPLDFKYKSSFKSMLLERKIVSEYYFNEKKVKPFFGLNFGFTQIKLFETKKNIFNSNKLPTFGPKVGVLLGSFRFSADYSMINDKISNLSKSDNIKIISFSIGKQFGVY